MKERPILFSGEMVRAILEGQKTQTRRVVKLNHAGRVQRGGKNWHLDDPNAVMACPYGKPGDRLWVRETFMGPLIDEDGDYPNGYHSPEFCEYRADGGPAPEWVDMDGENHQGWKPSIYMPRWASRILLEVTAVRVERLQEIDSAGAAAEGVKVPRDAEGNLLIDVSSKFSPAKYMQSSGTPNKHLARAFFASLWESINGAGSWDANPWVWVVEFRRVEA